MGDEDIVGSVATGLPRRWLIQFDTVRRFALRRRQGQVTRLCLSSVLELYPIGQGICIIHEHNVGRIGHVKNIHVTAAKASDLKLERVSPRRPEKQFIVLGHVGVPVVQLNPVDIKLIQPNVINRLHANGVASLVQVGMRHSHLVIVDDLAVPYLVVYLMIVEINLGVVIGGGVSLQSDVHSRRASRG